MPPLSLEDQGGAAFTRAHTKSCQGLKECLDIPSRPQSGHSAGLQFIVQILLLLAGIPTLTRGL